MENTFGKYRIAAPLTAKVSNPAYRARLSTAPEWNYVVKVYNEHQLHSLEAQEEWLRKMDTLIHLEHPHILPIAYGIEDELPYSVTEYIKSGSLHDRLNQVLPAQEVKKIILQVGQALQYAHEHCVFHGNIKPENVLFDENGDVLLVDFCVPRDPDETDHRLPTVGRFLETSDNVDDDQDEIQLTYYLPEEILSAKSDQHALGFLAYEMLSNQPGIVIPSPQLPAEQSLSKKAPLVASPPAQAWVAQIKVVLLKALAKEPGERYENVTALLEAINEVFTPQLTIAPITELLSEVRPVQMKKVVWQRPTLPHIETYQLMSLMLHSTKTLQLYKKRIGLRGGVIIVALFILGIFCSLLIWQSSFSLHPGPATVSSTSPARTPPGTKSGYLQRISTSTPILYVSATASTSSSGSATSTSPQSNNPSPPDGSSPSHGPYESSSSSSSSGNSSSLGGSSGSYNGDSSSSRGSSSSGGSSGSSPSSDPTPTPTFTPTPTPKPTPTPRPSRHCFWGPSCNPGGFGGGGFGGGGFGGRHFR